MRTSWSVGHLFGIDIRIDSSWVIIFAFVTWMLAGYYFPSQYANWPLWQYLLIGAMTSLLFFASVLIHELAHSLVALKQGEEVRSITLFILGGVAEIKDEPRKPSREFYMALVGPLSSLGIALVFLALWYWLRTISQPLAALCRYLALINLILGIFNLIPGFPMDGGRILRAVVWKITGNLRRATRVASVTGQAVAFLMIVFGMWQILRGFFFNGMWIALIGWFIHSAATRGYQQVLMKDMLKDLRAKDLMNRDFETVSTNLSVQELVEDYVLKKKERAFLVSDAGELQGIVCLEDIKTVAPERRASTRVKDIMTPREKLDTVSPDDNGNEVLSKLSSRNVHQIPVMEEGEVQGILCRGDVLRFLHLRSELGV
ncbi:site-2 protease family protein [Candidatus Aerophobetes bacterium]|uniref:Zinc metalloprotease n=1 Tax=Aerophobetes bacterium TaxID=2030807 RepID=A0A523W3S4_UNCAE|nr:MAG: site-2 protease family protein [Candidatus Aerophobetes bacterium]